MSLDYSGVYGVWSVLFVLDIFCASLISKGRGSRSFTTLKRYLTVHLAVRVCAS
ncbi:uncharacterized protein BO95DRAFT_442371 [Aspergillus brunneoviolaceus CBS 621.78]|uniref:Uncharacterized protein n=1 Tax=Aspergillus brunneoviolaceus CBS 621.78 TaxID=1450534 RepID=A0ACD1G9P5_9EURO|nr:hypothetical protein BO95DRAFT_442371 [Aspergillus brunneoviolaceus CBS 621.78]RAH46001.1 hypothetical protein BO95DRAFT_442371 [Aspergillus brunneoviolaceus CBS 621.78]